MPRRTRPRGRRRDPRDPDDEPRPLVPELALAAPPGWQVRAVAPARALKEYRCPGCDHEVRPGTAHVVAWQDGREDERRHWHTACWERGRRSLGR